jgi:hypothetical protein
MTRDDMPEKCFARETFPDDEPSHDWNLIQLEQYAQAQHEAIVQGETTLAPTYHRLGRSLELIRRKRGRGAWGKYLESLKIHRVRACKARAIACHFATPEEVEGMTVEAAYEAAKSNRDGASGVRRTRTGADHSDSQEGPEQEDAGVFSHDDAVDEVRTFLTDVRDRADQLIDTTAFLEQEKRTALIPAYRAALDQLHFLGRVLGAEEEPRGGREPPPRPEPEMPGEPGGMCAPESPGPS